MNTDSVNSSYTSSRLTTEIRYWSATNEAQRLFELEPGQVSVYADAIGVFFSCCHDTPIDRRDAASLDGCPAVHLILEKSTLGRTLGELPIVCRGCDAETAFFSISMMDRNRHVAVTLCKKQRRVPSTIGLAIPTGK